MIAFCVVATNKYIDFVDELIDSMDQFVQMPFKVILYTNMKYSRRKVTVVNIEHEQWPMPTLKRYHYITKNTSVFDGCSHIFYIDADMRIVDRVGPEILSNLVGVLHPGFFNTKEENLPYDRDPNSSAYIRLGTGSKYYCGGFNGGARDVFLGMSEIIKNKIDIDLGKGHIAIWHDESYTNKFMNHNKPTLVLDPRYCYPESWKIKMAHIKPIIIALDKNHEEVRSDTKA